MIAIGLALLAAAQPIEQMHVQPSSETAAVREFEATCLAGYRDLAALRQAVSASRRGYAEQSAAGSDEHWRDWTSPFGTIHYFETGGRKPDRGCVLTSFTPANVDRSVLIGEVDAMAGRHAASDLTEADEDNRITWFWRDAERRPVAVVAEFSRRTPQQIILSLHTSRN